MSDEQDTTPRKRGRPKGSGKPKGTPASGKSEKGTPLNSLLNQKRRQYSYSLMERIRERIDPDLLIEFHTMVLEGKTPVWEKIGNGDWKVVPDPSPLATSPTLNDKVASLKWLTERGYGLPVQSIQVDAEYRSKLELLGSGVPTNVLEGINPTALFYTQKALQAVLNASDAEIVEVNAPESTNSPLLESSSELLDKDNED
jgi:hypothetical protein